MKDEPAEAAPKPIPSVARDASYLTRSAVGPSRHFDRATITSVSTPISRHFQSPSACLKGAKLRKSHNEQMSAALDPTADMALLANTCISRNEKAPVGGYFQHPYTHRRGAITFSRYAKRLGNAPPCAAFVPTTVWLDSDHFGLR